MTNSSNDGEPGFIEKIAEKLGLSEGDEAQESSAEQHDPRPDPQISEEARHGGGGAAPAGGSADLGSAGPGIGGIGYTGGDANPDTGTPS
jgi:hypothetical protein